MTSSDTSSEQRISKLIARSGLCSRRQADELIAQGRVTYNGELVVQGMKALNTHGILVDNKPLPKTEAPFIWLFHKPKQCLVTRTDPRGRRTIFDIIPSDVKHLMAVGRLDYNSEGLLLLTNDGNLSRHLELPSTGWLRRYRVRISGKINDSIIQQLTQGITSDEGQRYKAETVTPEPSRDGRNQWVEVTLKEGKYREIRLMFAHFNLEVSRLIRTAYGPFQLGQIEKGRIKKVPNKVLAEQIGPSLLSQLTAEQK